MFCWLQWQVDEILSLVRQETSEVTNLIPGVSLERESSFFFFFCKLLPFFSLISMNKIVTLKSAQQGADIFGVILPQFGWLNWIYTADFFSLRSLGVLSHHPIEILEVNAVVSNSERRKPRSGDHTDVGLTPISSKYYQLCDLGT